MKKVYQTIVNKGYGNCMQAAIASLMNKDLDDVPNFISFNELWYEEMRNYLNTLGYDITGYLWNKNYNRLVNPTGYCFKEPKWHEPSMLTLKNIRENGGVDGFFYATVLSPKYFNYTDGFHQRHAVICDLNCHIVHDPNPEYSELISYPLSNLLGHNGIVDILKINKLND
jgi:hypothetical protein